LIAAVGALLASDHAYDPVWIAFVVLIISAVWVFINTIFSPLGISKI